MGALAIGSVACSGERAGERRGEVLDGGVEGGLVIATRHSPRSLWLTASRRTVAFRRHVTSAASARTLAAAASAAAPSAMARSNFSSCRSISITRGLNAAVVFASKESSIMDRPSLEAAYDADAERAQPICWAPSRAESASLSVHPSALRRASASLVVRTRATGDTSNVSQRTAQALQAAIPIAHGKQRL